MDRIEKLKQFLLANPDDSFSKHALALEYIKKGDDATARELFEGILCKEPEYVGSYYHLGKLFERSQQREPALEWYQKGMAAAKKANDNHAYNELRSAYEDLLDS